MTNKDLENALMVIWQKVFDQIKQDTLVQDNYAEIQGADHFKANSFKTLAANGKNVIVFEYCSPKVNLETTYNYFTEIAWQTDKVADARVMYGRGIMNPARMVDRLDWWNFNIDEVDLKNMFSKNYAHDPRYSELIELLLGNVKLNYQEAKHDFKEKCQQVAKARLDNLAMED